MRLEGKPVILIGDGPAADAKARLLERAGARIVGEDSAEATLAVVADGDEAAAARLRARGLLVNVVDRPDLCDFTLPAIIDRDPVLVAIGTGGASAGLAAALRQRLEPLLPAGLGKLAEALLGARESLRVRFPDIDVRRRAIGGLLAAGGPLDPLADHDDPAAAITTAEAAPGRIERIEIADADADLLTLRAARLLGLADRLYIEGSVPTAILDRARADAVRIAQAPPRVPAPGLSLHLIWTPQ
ncbi:MAG TPA: NAD(P)-dependent oxidoreductase [Sphingomonas sp.]|uniref:precorrin-2 dehydrogenase/sirohydrochlorin ferrochelatase family protein n=1 Tax=Sphingomonas sp. TaxID=28214 RepID=UPI002CE81317|nr:NAD(P)-dependent oxidoreductase [Sphingomonas sp.]HMI19601.1 NAD(P)-dependent oxidoreductase [Sphingomonas sp.]